ncbi:MOSC domain-containing protein [Acidisoma cellulosilytica]|uniref:MOSC domain-containing protein n=1 Tax=Acidisoma cellulosilyticum TaxID=2802395 RepID=A0A963Z6W5_9PROT|nr:MOSC N-terminal beta barrel domain-containing protein [Acidisoma cellulosilyticum]MCB8883671.1 MOSC domain-containing protein [Acidisoma cellulosilyticum]
MVHVTELYRYPIKGLSAQPTDVLPLSETGGVAHDRSYGLALGTTMFDPRKPEPLDKGHFLMLRANESLARLQTHFSEQTSILTIQQNGRDVMKTNLSSDEGRAAAETFFTDFAGLAARGRIRLVDAPGHKFTDVSVVSPVMMRAISVINLATVRSLESAVGHEIHPLRFRANVYLEGLEAGSELDWVGREISIGGVRFRGALRTRRCAAIDVNPITAERDTHLPRAIFRHFGHSDLGIYLEILGDGYLTVGDPVH